jgi:hypothetical protein
MVQGKRQKQLVFPVAGFITEQKSMAGAGGGWGL